MIDLWDEPHSETAEFDVFFSNVLGVCSMVTVMRKDKKPIVYGGRLRTAFVAFIDLPSGIDNVRFAWHDNVNELADKPFTQEWALQEFLTHRERLL